MMKHSARGFTLIEIMVVMAIIVAVVGLALPRLGQSVGSQAKRVTRQIVSLNKELRNFARLKQKTYRLVIDFGSEKSGSGMYVESAPRLQLTISEKDQEDEDANKDEKEKGPFALDKEVLKKPIELPYGVQFESVEVDGIEQPITSGQAYIHFFPHGLVQKAIINIGNGGNLHWSLVILPLTGQTIIKTEKVRLRDLEET